MVATAIFDECQAIWEWFDIVSIERCNREANQVAHTLAGDSFMSKQSCNWIEEPPSIIIGDLANDVTIFFTSIKLVGWSSQKKTLPTPLQKSIFPFNK